MVGTGPGFDRLRGMPLGHEREAALGGLVHAEKIGERIIEDDLPLHSGFEDFAGESFGIHGFAIEVEVKASAGEGEAFRQGENGFTFEARGEGGTEIEALEFVEGELRDGRGFSIGESQSISVSEDVMAIGGAANVHFGPLEAILDAVIESGAGILRRLAAGAAMGDDLDGAGWLNRFEEWEGAKGCALAGQNEEEDGDEWEAGSRVVIRFGAVAVSLGGMGQTGCEIHDDQADGSIHPAFRCEIPVRIGREEAPEID